MIADKTQCSTSRQEILPLHHYSIRMILGAMNSNEKQVIRSFFVADYCKSEYTEEVEVMIRCLDLSPRDVVGGHKVP